MDTLASFSFFESTVIPLISLTLMETILGIDNVIFISILVGRVEASRRELARKLGLLLALLMRLGLLFSMSWLMSLTEPFLKILSWSFSGRDLILLVGGLFLLTKATHEIYTKVESLESDEANAQGKAKNSDFLKILGQIVVLDLVFSLDSVITAVGVVQELWIMSTAVVLSVGIMLVSARSIGVFVEKHPSVKILALSFLLMIGVMLVMEGTGSHVEKGYIYFGMAFSLLVELLNLRYRTKRRFGSSSKERK